MEVLNKFFLMNDFLEDLIYQNKFQMDDRVKY